LIDLEWPWCAVELAAAKSGSKHTSGRAPALRPPGIGAPGDFVVSSLVRNFSFCGFIQKFNGRINPD